VAILGSTGSIGRQALDVIRRRPDLFQVVALVAGSDGATLRRQAAEFGVPTTGLGTRAAADIAQHPDVDVVLNGVVGAAGLRASIAALEAGKTLALANKESLVAAGELCLDAAMRSDAHIVPVDSEHSAIAQCLDGRDSRTVSRIVLTASGGPFRGRTNVDDVTPDQALSHPTWTMGRKITIDSATMMNKGLEVIEAHFLFGASYDNIDVLVHPQSVVHGMVELVDGSLLMQAATTDMRLPIAAALAYPVRLEATVPKVDLAVVSSLEFERVDESMFPAVKVAYETGRAGGTAPAVLNAANEVAVHAFLGRRLSFAGITDTVKSVLDRHEVTPADDLEAVLEADAWARKEAETVIASTGGGI
jgi:1-deoxy-D-xylulose-5-phosphate reductoisomerase